MNGERTAKNPRFIPEALWPLDWQCMGSLLDEAAIQKLEQAGWAIFFAQISETGMQPMLGSGRVRDWQDSRAESIAGVYPVSDDLKQTMATRKLCELVKAKYSFIPEKQQGGWMSYEGQDKWYVAIFFPSYQYPPESAAERIMAETGNCLSFVKPLCEAQTQIAEIIAQKPELGQKPKPVMSRMQAETAVQQMLTDWIKENGDTLDPNLERLTGPDSERYQNLQSTKWYHPIDFMKDCRDNPDYLRVLAQSDLIALTKRRGSP
ncbi:MAG: hypothetical protein V9G98_25970 [Candidatus Competibacter sp.]